MRCKEDEDLVGKRREKEGKMAEEETKEKQKKIMVAIDESECSRYALQWVLDNLSEMLQSSQLIVFTAIPIDFSGVYAGSYGSVPLDLITAIQDKQKKFAAALLEKAKELCAQYGVDAEAISVMGNPKEAICDAVQKYNCRLLLVGSHGRGAIQRAFLGSVSNYCLHNAKCPVLVVRQPV